MKELESKNTESKKEVKEESFEVDNNIFLSQQSFRDLVHYKSWENELSWDLFTLLGEYERVFEVFKNANRYLSEKYGLQDDKGKYLMNPNGTIKIDPTKAFEYSVEGDELMKKKSTFKCKKPTINKKDLPKGILSPADLWNLKDLINWVDPKKPEETK